MDDLIPFLIVIAISIIGAATRKKKKRPFFDTIVDEVPHSEHQHDDFLSWMDKINVNPVDPVPFGFAEPEQQKPIDEEVYQPLKYEALQYQPEQYANYSGFISPDEKAQMVAKEAPRAIEKEVKDDLTSESIKTGEIGKERIKVQFDLKKAVIYSELLNRKYN